MKGKCSAKKYKDNTAATVNSLVCAGGYGQPQCKYYRACLVDHGIRLTKDDYEKGLYYDKYSGEITENKEDAYFPV